MLEKVRKMDIKDFVMILACVISVGKNMLDSSEIFSGLNSYTNLLLAIFFLCIVYKLMTQTYSIFSIGIMTVLISTAAFSAFSIKYYSLLYSVMFIIAMQDCKFDQILKASFITKIAILSTHIAAYVFSSVLFPASITYVYRNGIKRDAFFMHHPNTFTVYLTWTSMELIYLCYQRIKAWHLLVVWGINLLFYHFTNSNSGILVITFTCLCVLLDKKGMQKEKGIIHYLSKYGFGFFSILFLVIAQIYSHLSGVLKNIWDMADSLLTGRLLYGAYTVNNYGFTWLGKSFLFPEKSYWNGHWIDSIYFDNVYYQMYFLIGAVFLVILSVSLILIANRTSYHQKLFISSCVVYGVMENYIINIFIVFPFMLIGTYLLSKKESPAFRRTF